MMITCSIISYFQKHCGCFCYLQSLWKILLSRNYCCSIFALNFQLLWYNIWSTNLSRYIMFTGDHHYSPNVHMLLHLPDAVRNLGPLWAHSTFPSENMNGWLRELYHGTRDPQKQVLSVIAIVHKICLCCMHTYICYPFTTYIYLFSSQQITCNI